MADFQHRRRAPSAYARILTPLTSEVNRPHPRTGSISRCSHEHQRTRTNPFVFQRCNGVLVVLAMSDGASK